MFGELSVIAAAICWAVGASLYRKGVLNVGAEKLNLFRSFPVAIYGFLILYLLAKWDLLYELDLVTIAYIGISAIIVLAIGDTFYFVGLNSVGVAMTVPIAYSYSIFVALISTVFLGETLSVQTLLGTVAVVVGVWLVGGRTKSERRKPTIQNAKRGVLAALATSLCWACGLILFKIILSTTDPFVLSAVRMLFVLPTLGFYTVIPIRTKVSAKRLSKIDVLTIFLSGLLSLGIGDTLLYVGLENANANVAAPLASTTPLFAAIIAIGVLNEKVSKRVVIGTILITFGTALLTIAQNSS